MTTPSDPLPADLAAAHAMILEQRELLTLAKSEVTVGRLEIERLKLMLAKARRERFGQSSERGRLLVEQLELAIEDLEETQAEQEAKAEIAAPEAAKQKRAQNPRSNLPVAVTSDTPTICTVVDGNVIPIKMGACSITALQVGNASYLPARVQQAFDIVQGTNKITFTSPGDLKIDDMPPALVATSASGLPVTLHLHHAEYLYGQRHHAHAGVRGRMRNRRQSRGQQRLCRGAEDGEIQHD